MGQSRVEMGERGRDGCRQGIAAGECGGRGGVGGKDRRLGAAAGKQDEPDGERDAQRHLPRKGQRADEVHGARYRARDGAEGRGDEPPSPVGF